MKKVKFIEIKAKSIGWTPGRGSKFIFPNINETVASFLEEGWEYCGYVPLETSAVSSLDKISLIFEKEIESKEKIVNHN